MTRAALGSRVELEKELARLKRLEVLYADAQNAAQIGMWEWEVATNEVTWTLGLYRIYDLDPKRHRPSYDGYLRLVHADDRERVSRVIQRALNERAPFSHDERILRPDGTVRYIHTWGHAVCDARGRVTSLVGVCQDVTDARAAREAERRGYALLQAVVEGSPDGVFLKDLHGRYLMINAAGARMLGRNPSELVGATDAGLFSPEEAARVSAADKEVLASRKPQSREVSLWTAEGPRVLHLTSAVWLDASGVPAGTISTAQDVTERKIVEIQRDELLRRERQARLEADAARRAAEVLARAGETLAGSLDFKEAAGRAASACVPALADWCTLFTVEPDGRIVGAGSAHVDPARAKLLAEFLSTHAPTHGGGGVGSVIASGRPMRLTVVTPFNVARAAFDETHQRLLQSFGLTSCMILPLEARGRILGGMCFWSAVSGRRYLESDQKLGQEFARRVACALDNARLCERALRSEERYRMIVETAEEGIVVLDAGGRVSLANDAFCRLVGRARDEVSDLSALELLGRRERGWVASRLAAPPAVGAKQHEVSLVRKDGAEVPALMSTSGWRGGALGFAGDIAMFADLTGVKKLERQLVEAQRLEAVGRLAGGVAHDFNNLLAVILAAAEALKKGVKDGRAREGDLDEILKAARSAARLTRQLLAFGRAQVLQPSVLIVNSVVADSEALLERVLGDEIALSVALDPRLAPCRVDAGQLEQVLLNLAVNARDAMPRGGRLTIETANASLSEDEAAALGTRPGAHSRVTVSGTGEGITPETLEHVFEPCFTLKPPGKGTRLGLAMVYGIVKQSGGGVRAKSEPGKGTCFEIFLPAALPSEELNDALDSELEP